MSRDVGIEIAHEIARRIGEEEFDAFVLRASLAMVERGVIAPGEANGVEALFACAPSSTYGHVEVAVTVEGVMYAETIKALPSVH